MADVIPFPLERRISEYRADYSELTEAERRAEPPGVAELFARSTVTLPCDTEPAWPPAGMLGQPQRD